MIYDKKPGSIYDAIVVAINTLIRLNGICPECEVEWSDGHQSTCMTGKVATLANNEHARMIGFDHAK